MNTVRIEYQTVNHKGVVLHDWVLSEGSVDNNPQIYTPRAYQIKRAQNCTPYTIRVRVVSEQTNQLVDMLP